MLVSTIQHCESVIYIPSLLSLRRLPPSHRSKSSQSARLGSLCYLATSHWLSISHMVVYIRSVLLSQFVHSHLPPLGPQVLDSICICSYVILVFLFMLSLCWDWHRKGGACGRRSGEPGGNAVQQVSGRSHLSEPSGRHSRIRIRAVVVGFVNSAWLPSPKPGFQTLSQRLCKLLILPYKVPFLLKLTRVGSVIRDENICCSYLPVMFGMSRSAGGVRDLHLALPASCIDSTHQNWAKLQLFLHNRSSLWNGKGSGSGTEGRGSRLLYHSLAAVILCKSCLPLGP